MAILDRRIAEQIRHAEKRLKRGALAIRKRPRVPHTPDDWRAIESPPRVLRRLVSLGLDELAGADLDHDAAPVLSARTAAKRVSLLERIIAENDLVAARFLHKTSAAARAVGRIHIRRGRRTVGYGTGFLVSPRLLMTNHHVLETAALAAGSVVEFDYYERSNGRTGPTATHALRPNVFFLTDARLDFTLLAVAERSTGDQPLAGRGWLPLIAESGKALVGEPVNLIEHPGGAPQQIAIRNNEVVAVIGDFLHYVADTEPGSSGSPVLNMQCELAALHHAGIPQRDAAGNILLRDGSVWDGRYAKADRIRWIANEGVRISSIVKKIEQALESDSPERKALFAEAVQKISPTILPAAWQEAGRPDTTPNGGPILIATATDGTSDTAARTAGLDGEMDDATLDRLAPEEVASIIAGLEERSLEVTLAEAAAGEVLVAEGDSWFDYKLAGLDIVDCLRWFHGRRIYNVAQAGDTLENMAWGGPGNSRRRRGEPPLKETLRAVRRYKPRAVLLSGGGNDIAGEAFSGFVNHRSSGLPPLREDLAEFVIGHYLRKAFETIVDRIWQIDDTIHILAHGYGYPVPDGRPILRLLGFSLYGPWLRPALTAKGHTAPGQCHPIVHTMIDLFNDMLGDLAVEYGNGPFHYIDLRPIIGRDDWANELHLRNSAYRRVAAEFDRVIRLIQ